MYYERILEQAIKKTSKTFPAVLVTGPRQVGKTTLLTKMADNNRTIVSLDNPTIRSLAREDPGLFLQRYKPPVLIDEVQYAPELFVYIKMYVDEHKNNGDFWLTGSQAFQMMENITESLAGRVGIVRLSGLSNAEVQQTFHGEFVIDMESLIKRKETSKVMDANDIFQRIYKGSMPRLYENPEIDLEQYYESYIETYITRDIKELTKVADEMLFLNFVRAAAARTASNVNFTELAEEVGISSPTAKQWLSLLVTSGLVLLIQPFSNNALHRVIKTPRMYFMDTGLCAYLTGWNSPGALERGAMNGAFFETWVVTEIYKSYLNVGKNPPLYFYRDSNHKEIDLLIYQNATLYPIEIKKGTQPKNATRNFSVLKKFADAGNGQKALAGNGAVICLAPDVIPIDRMNCYVPAWVI
ncbi:MAG: ATP-binding protein [Lachnospiraceae bacterium]|nr:ATP-binding protein [Lachnospiraceae bacterium]